VLGRPLAEGYPYLEEEVRHAVHHEYACTAEVSFNPPPPEVL
jgi:hypothetical protein